MALVYYTGLYARARAKPYIILKIILYIYRYGRYGSTKLVAIYEVNLVPYLGMARYGKVWQGVYTQFYEKID